MGYRMEQHMVQILDGLFLGDFQVGFYKPMEENFLSTLFELC